MALALKAELGATAVLYKNNRLIKTKRAYLGSADEYTVLEAELVGILLALSLLYNLSCQLITNTLVGLDNQAALRWGTPLARHTVLSDAVAWILCVARHAQSKCLGKHVQTILWLLHSRKFPPPCVSTPSCSPGPASCMY